MKRIEGYFIEGCQWRCGKKRWCYMNARGGLRVDSCIRVVERDGKIFDVESGREYNIVDVKRIGFLREVEDEAGKLGSAGTAEV